MIVIAKDAENKMLRKIYDYKSGGQVKLCYHLMFSETSLPKEQLFTHFFDLLQDIPKSYLAQVFVCQDQDVFIWMNDFMQRHFIQFLEALSSQLKKENMSSVSHVYEVGEDKDILKEICRKKLDKINQTEQEKAEKALQKATYESVLETLSTLDPLNVKTVAERRASRDESVIMVVDDDQLARTLVGNVLEKEFSLSFAKNGKQALRKFVDSAPDVVFLDIGLPDISGHHVLEVVFQIDPDAYVIMFSGRKDKENMLKALRTGAQGFVGKPFTREKLFQYIEKSPFIERKGNNDMNVFRNAF